MNLSIIFKNIVANYQVILFIMGIALSLMGNFYNLIKNIDDHRFFRGTWTGMLSSVGRGGGTNQMDCKIVLFEQDGALLGTHTYVCLKTNGVSLEGRDELINNTDHFVCENEWHFLIFWLGKLLRLSGTVYRAKMNRDFHIAFRKNDSGHDIEKLDYESQIYHYIFTVKNRFFKPRCNIKIMVPDGDDISMVSGQIRKIR